MAMQTASLADETLKRLIDGNRRYAANQAVHPNATPSRRVEAAKYQKPAAMILGCVDSRVPPELVFDCGLGDLFVIRTAGQVLDNAVMGSLEFGVAELHIPLLVVLGHEKCGAVKATLEAIEKNVVAEADIYTLVKAIRPAVEATQSQPGDWLDNAVRAHVGLIINRLKDSSLLAEAVGKGELRIVGARYGLETGIVEITVS